MNTEIYNAVKAAGDKAQYDAYAKRVIAQKSILARILISTVDEFRGMSPEEVAGYIEGEPYIGNIPSEPGLTNKSMTREDMHGKGIPERIVGLNTENTEISEGMIRFDILFYVRISSGLTKMIINIEVQKDEPGRYGIMNRAIFYVCRMISSQKERDFTSDNYDDIKRVFSIWVCMNMDENSMTHVKLARKDMLEPHEWKGNTDLINIILIGITSELPDADSRHELHRLLSALLSDRLDIAQKSAIIEKEYGISMDNGLREEVNVMCNLSEGIVERTTKERDREIIMTMHANGFDLEQIALATGKSREAVEAVIAGQEV